MLQQLVMNLIHIKISIFRLSNNEHLVHTGTTLVLCANGMSLAGWLAVSTDDEVGRNCRPATRRGGQI